MNLPIHRHHCKQWSTPYHWYWVHDSHHRQSHRLEILQQWLCQTFHWTIGKDSWLCSNTARAKDRCHCYLWTQVLLSALSCSLSSLIYRLLTLICYVPLIIYFKFRRFYSLTKAIQKLTVYTLYGSNLGIKSLTLLESKGILRPCGTQWLPTLWPGAPTGHEGRT